MRYSFSQFKDSKKTVQQTDAVSPLSEPPEADNEQLVRKMCDQIMMHSEGDDQQSSLRMSPAHAKSSLKQKIERRRKLMQHRNHTKPQYSSKMSNGIAKVPVNGIAGSQKANQPSQRARPSTKASPDVTTPSRSFGKQFHCPKNDALLKMSDSQGSSTTGGADSARSTPDFLKYKGMASLHCFRRESRDDSETERNNLRSQRCESPFLRSSPFSFESQSTVSTREKIEDARLKNRRNDANLLRNASLRSLSLDEASISSRTRPLMSTGIERESPIPRSLCFSPTPKPNNDKLPTKLRSTTQYEKPLVATKPTTIPGKTRSSSFSDSVRSSPGGSAFAAYRTEKTSVRTFPSPVIPRTSSDAENSSQIGRMVTPSTQTKTASPTSPSRRQATIARVLTDSARNRTVRTSPVPTPPAERKGGAPIYQKYVANRTTANWEKNRAVMNFLERQAARDSMRSTQDQPNIQRQPETDRNFATPLHIASGMVLRGATTTTDPSPPTTPTVFQQTAQKSSFRLEHATLFANEINLYKEGEFSCPKPAPTLVRRHGLSVFVRKRPLLRCDRDDGNFDVLGVNRDTLASGKKRPKSTTITVFRTNATSDGKTKLIQPVTFGCYDDVFDQHVDGDRLYRAVVKPLIQSVQKNRKPAALLVLGQPGSGKCIILLYANPAPYSPNVVPSRSYVHDGRMCEEPCYRNLQLS